jgi:hypothetical protein
VWDRHKPIIVLALVGVASYGLYMLYRYIQVERDLSKRSEAVVEARVDDNSVSEIGYIYAMRDELFLRDDNTINLVWFVKVPATGERYSCVWDGGFSRFKTGDDVQLIRPRDVSEEAGYGYVTGLHDQLRGKSSSVWVNDEESLELDLEPEPEYP